MIVYRHCHKYHWYSKGYLCHIIIYSWLTNKGIFHRDSQVFASELLEDYHMYNDAGPNFQPIMCLTS